MQTWCTNICMMQLLKNRMSSISSNLYEENRPITFHVLECWIFMKKNLVQWMTLKLGDLFFYKKLLWEVKKAEKWLERKKRRRRKREKSKCLTVYCWVVWFIVAASNDTLSGIGSFVLLFSLVIPSFISLSISSNSQK